MSNAIQASQRLLKHMPPGSRCRLFTFGNDVQATTPWTTDRDVLTEAASRIRPAGRTALFRALATASTEPSDRPGRRHLILCTDGKGTVGGESESEVVARCRTNQISLHTIGIEGVRNYEIWMVALWLGNERSSYDRWKEEARRLWDEAGHDSEVIAERWSREEKTELDLSSSIAEAVREVKEDVREGLLRDLLNAALAAVAWPEVAEHFLADLPEFNSKKQR